MNSKDPEKSQSELSDTDQTDRPHISGGYYIKARCIRDSWIAHARPIIREVWDYLLREANHTDQTYNGFTVKRGQLFRSYRDIRNDLSWHAGFRVERYHESAMKRAMGALMGELMIELTSEPRGNLITILNYDFYQDPKNYGRTYGRTDGRTNGEPVANRQRSAINNKTESLKHLRTKKTPPIPPQGDQGGGDSFFSEFWNACSEKVRKADALIEWDKVISSGVAPKTLIDAMQHQVEFKHFRNATGEDRPPHPANWLKRRLWEDEVVDRRTDPAGDTPTATSSPKEWVPHFGGDHDPEAPPATPEQMELISQQAAARLRQKRPVIGKKDRS